MNPQERMIVCGVGLALLHKEAVEYIVNSNMKNNFVFTYKGKKYRIKENKNHTVLLAKIGIESCVMTLFLLAFMKAFSFETNAVFATALFIFNFFNSYRVLRKAFSFQKPECDFNLTYSK